MTFIKNTFKAIVIYILTIEARLVLRKYKPRIIAISGSVGKTSTKDAIYSVLEKEHFVRKSDKSFNGDIGVPLTILGLHNGWFNPIIWIKNIIKGALLIIFADPYPKVLILEIGADKPREIEKIVSWLKPNMAIGTRFPRIPVHVEFFASPQAVIDEDALVLKETVKNGTVVLNWDDPEMMAFRKDLPQGIITYGMNIGADVQGVDPHIIYDDTTGMPVGIGFTAIYEDVKTTVTMRGALGHQHIYPLLGAIAVGIKEGMELPAIATHLAGHQSPPGRMHLLEGIKETLIIDDTYNASPVAMDQAIKTMANIEQKTGGRKIFALGDMLELGSHTSKEHAQAGEQVAKVADILVAVGIRSRGLAKAAEDAGFPGSSIVTFDDSRKAGEYLKNTLSKGDIALIKGSQSIRMERAVEAIMAHPEDKENLLVRQDPVWLTI